MTVAVGRSGFRGRPAISELKSVSILFGTETGNSEEIAGQLFHDAERLGLSVTSTDLADFDFDMLATLEDVLVIVSTFGEGDPPQPAWRFFEALEAEDAPRLDGLRYAVCALGDSSYEFFCGAGKRLDARFEQLGAERLCVRVDCDIDYEAASSEWRAAVLGLLSPSPDAFGALAASPAVPSGENIGYDKRHPIVAPICRNVPLLASTSTKHTRHVEFDLCATGISYQPGDALGVYPTNDLSLVRAILEAGGLAGAAIVRLGEDELSLEAALLSRFEISLVTPRLLEFWARAHGANKFKYLLREENSRERTEFLQNHHLLDLFRMFPLGNLDTADFLAALRPLQPRLYSIASSQAAVGEAVHLTVSLVEYDLHGTKRLGVASGQFLCSSPEGTELPIYLHPSPHFHLPDDDVPIILIGAGTGVAPYRGFLQERQARGASGGAFMFMGERNISTDFLYKEDWEQFLKVGVLTRLETAFSRDGIQKNYVQHRMREHSRDVADWLEAGAHIYVCGDAFAMAPAVHEALIDAVGSGLSISRKSSEAYIQQIMSSHRYHRDVY